MAFSLIPMAGGFIECHLTLGDGTDETRTFGISGSK
jgi:hypothetical protein